MINVHYDLRDVHTCLSHRQEPRCGLRLQPGAAQPMRKLMHKCIAGASSIRYWVMSNASDAFDGLHDNACAGRAGYVHVSPGHRALSGQCRVAVVDK